MAQESVHLPGVVWHVTVTLHGIPQEASELAEALDRLVFAHGIGLSARYSADSVELRYWDEGHDCRVVAGHGLDLWDEHREESHLPNWVVVGVEILDRQFFQRRWPPGSLDPELMRPGVQRITGKTA